MRFEDAENIEIDGFEGRQALGSNKPVIGLRNVNYAYIHNCQADEETKIFLEAAENSKNILFKNNDLRRAANALLNVDNSEVIESGNIK